MNPYKLLTCLDLEAHQEVTDKISGPIAVALSEKLGLSKEEATIYSDELLNAAYEVVGDLVKEYSAPKKSGYRQPLYDKFTDHKEVY